MAYLKQWAPRAHRPMQLVRPELLSGPAIAQAAVFGEARPRLCALVVPAAGASAAAIDAQVRAANSRLPDYARIGAWLPADTPFTTGVMRPMWSSADWRSFSSSER